MSRLARFGSRYNARHLLAGGVAMLVLTGCASVSNPDPRDPFESFNRGVYAFNERLDEAVLKPVATAYKQITPPLVRTGVGNFLGNLEDGWSSVNSLLQGKLRHAVDNFFRFGVNSTFGLFGVLDVANEMQIDRHAEDFGQTLGVWGFGPGPYLMLPALGSSSVRDTVALPLDWRGNLAAYVHPVAARNSVFVINLVDTRASLLTVSSSLDEVALDKYSFIRDAFLQRRRNAVFDGDPPEADDSTEP